jgi:SAM-dependent methyltransferase
MKRSVTDRQWDKWAADDPYRGVLGVDTTTLGDEAIKTAFFASGETHIAHVQALVDQFFGGIKPATTVLDFGCGVGRLVRPLAARFEHAIGIDISPKMLEIAHGNLSDYSNVTLTTSLDEIERSGKSIGLVHSYIVLQHIRPEQGLPIIKRLLGLLSDGGVFALHVTTGDSKPLRGGLNWIRYRFPPAHWAYNLARRRPLGESITEMNRYDPFALLEMAKAAGCPATLAIPFNQNGHKGIMLIGKVRPGPIPTA